jgi:hypothetical protein
MRSPILRSSCAENSARADSPGLADHPPEHPRSRLAEPPTPGRRRHSAFRSRSVSIIGHNEGAIIPKAAPRHCYEALPAGFPVPPMASRPLSVTRIPASSLTHIHVHRSRSPAGKAGARAPGQNPEAGLSARPTADGEPLIPPARDRSSGPYPHFRGSGLRENKKNPPKAGPYCIPERIRRARYWTPACPSGPASRRRKPSRPL